MHESLRKNEVSILMTIFTRKFLNSLFRALSVDVIFNIRAVSSLKIGPSPKCSLRSEKLMLRVLLLELCDLVTKLHPFVFSSTFLSGP